MLYQYATKKTLADPIKDIFYLRSKSEHLVSKMVKITITQQ